MKFLLALLLSLSLNAQPITSTGYGSNSEESIAKDKAFTNAKVEALNVAGVQITAELEHTTDLKRTQHGKLDEFKEEVKSKIFQKSEGLVTLIKIINTSCSKENQIFTCELKAKFEIKKSDIKNSFEIMKKLDSLYENKVSKTQHNKLIKEIDNLKSKISNPQLSKIINKNTSNIINNIEVLVENQIDIKNQVLVKNKVVNNTDNLLYFIVAGLLLVIIWMLFLFSRKKDIVVNIENPNYKEIIDKHIQAQNINLTLDKKIFYEGEKLSINFKIESKFNDWYIYGYNIDDKNDIVPLDLIQDDEINANQKYIFPTWSDGYDIASPFGYDIIKIFVSNKAIKKPTLDDTKSEIFTNSNTRGLKNTQIQKELSKKTTISKFDLVAYYRGFSDECEVFERSIEYKTKERR